MLGGNDPATAQALNSLAAVYAGQKRYAEAERLSRRALTIQEEALDPEDRRLVPTLDDLTSSYLRQRQFGDALELTGRAYAIARKTYGDGHLFTAQRMINRAIVLAHLGRYPEAGELLLQALVSGGDAPGRESHQQEVERQRDEEEQRHQPRVDEHDHQCRIA